MTSDRDRDDLERRVLADQEVVQRLALPAAVDDLLSLPLTIAQLKCLLVVLADGTSTGADLGRRLDLSAPTISGVVDRLVEGGYLVREASTEDRRVVTLQPSERTHAWAEGVAHRLQSRWADVVSRLDADELDHLARGTAALRRVLEGSAPSEDPGVR